MCEDLFFSVVIPLYNKGLSVKRTIECALNQTYPHFELIIVDDGSTDCSLEIVKSFIDNRIRIISQRNAGVSAARNRGIRESQFDLVAFLDADDLWEPNYLEEMAGLIQDVSEAGLYGCAYDKSDGEKNKPVNFCLSPGYCGKIKNYFSHAKKNHLFWTSAVIIRKSALKITGAFDERINTGEDLDLWFRIAFSFPVAFLNKVLAHYNTGDQNRASLKKHDFSKSFLCYTYKYKPIEADNKDLRVFINHFRIQKLPKLFLSYDLDDDLIKEHLRLIDPRGQKFRHQLFLKAPFFLKKRLIDLFF